MVGEIKALFKVLFMFLPLPVFWTLFDQQVRGYCGKLGVITSKLDITENHPHILSLSTVFNRPNICHKEKHITFLIFACISSSFPQVFPHTFLTIWNDCTVNGKACKIDTSCFLL